MTQRAGVSPSRFAASVELASVKNRGFAAAPLRPPRGTGVRARRGRPCVGPRRIAPAGSRQQSSEEARCPRCAAYSCVGGASLVARRRRRAPLQVPVPFAPPPGVDSAGIPSAEADFVGARSPCTAPSARVVSHHFDGLRLRRPRTHVAACTRSWGSPVVRWSVPPASERSTRPAAGGVRMGPRAHLGVCDGRYVETSGTCPPSRPASVSRVCTRDRLGRRPAAQRSRRPRRSGAPHAAEATRGPEPWRRPAAVRATSRAASRPLGRSR